MVIVKNNIYGDNIIKIHNISRDEVKRGCMGFLPLLRESFRRNPAFKGGAHNIFALYLILLFEAAPFEKSVFIGITQYSVPRGVLIKSQLSLAAKLRCNRKTVAQRLSKLASLREVSVTSKTFHEGKKISIIRLNNYERDIWEIKERFQDMKVLLASGGYIPLDRQRFLALPELLPGGYHQWVLFLYLCVEAQHSRSVFLVDGERLALERGQLIRSLDQLAQVMYSDRTTIMEWIGDLKRKKLISIVKRKLGARLETLVITVVSYNYYVWTVTNADMRVDMASDNGEDTALASSENVLRIPNKLLDNENKSIGIQPAVAAVLPLPTIRNPKPGTEEKVEDEDELVEEILEWAFSPENNFMIRTSPETFKKQIKSSIKRIGIDKMDVIFIEAQERYPWDALDPEQVSALTMFWDRIHQEMEASEGK